MLKNLHMTISKDLVDPLIMIGTSAKWLIIWLKQLNKLTVPVQNTEALENLYNILVASKMSLFKCRDLLQINKDEKESTNLTQFRL